MIVRTLTFLLCASAALLADQVVLKNGDTLTGSVIQKDGGKLTLKSELLGEVSIPWTAVKSLKTDQALVVVLPSGEAVKGKISTNGDNLEVASKSAPLAGVGAIRDEEAEKQYEKMLHPGITELWAGSFDLGLALARGNARTETLTNDFNVARVARHSKISMHFNEIYGRALVDNVDSLIASAVRGGWAYSRDITPKIFVTTLNEYEHDAFQSLDLRAVFGGGFGWNAVKTAKTQFSLQAGGDYDHESFTTLKRNSAEAFVGDDLLWKASSVTSVTQSLRAFPNLSDGGEYRLNFDLTAVTAIKKWLGWHVTFSDRFVSNPLPGKLRNDVLLSTGLRISFARK
jgi:putative salt-induced outer membrane protein YdiY